MSLQVVTTITFLKRHNKHELLYRIQGPDCNISSSPKIFFVSSDEGPTLDELSERQRDQTEHRETPVPKLSV